MAFRFFRRVKIAPGVSVNLSKTGGSLSFGPRGAKVTVGKRGVRRTVGVPGTGMYWTEQAGRGRSRGRARGRSRTARRSSRAPAANDRLTLGFFERLVTPKREEAFVDGLRALTAGDEAGALRQLARGEDSPDAAFLAGMLALKRERYDDAHRWLSSARKSSRSLGRLFDKHGVEASVMLPITEELSALVGVDARGALLGLVEVHQARRQWRPALHALRALHKRDPDDLVVRLSMAEILVEDDRSRRAMRQAVDLASGVENRSPIHAALLLYKAKALRALGMPTPARDALTALLRRKKDRPEALLLEARCQRALVYETLGRKKQARADLERVFAADPSYEDVAQQLGFQ